MTKHLWEVDHPYYCSESNFFSNDCHIDYDTWELFLESEGPGTDTDDMSMNLLFRWDWDKPSKRLSLFFMGQRKGLFRVVFVRGMSADEEPAVREWLQKRWAHLQLLWEPIS